MGLFLTRVESKGRRACFEAIFFFLFEKFNSQFLFPEENQLIKRFKKDQHLMEGHLCQTVSIWEGSRFSIRAAV